MRFGSSRQQAPEQKAAADAADLLTMARQAAGAGQYGTAADLYRRALSLQPAEPAAGVGLGDALLAMHQPQEAAEAYKLVLDGGRPDSDAARGYARDAGPEPPGGRGRPARAGRSRPP